MRRKKILLLSTLTANLETIGKPPENTEIAGISDDSRKIEAGYIFAAIRGEKFDGTEYIGQAISQGAAAIIVPKNFSVPPEYLSKTCFIPDNNPRLLLSLFAAKIYSGQPKFIAAVTGTNGKTSVANFCRQIWELLGVKSASIGTIGIIGPGEKKYDAGESMTTPGPAILYQKIAELKKAGVEYLAIEASSHGLDQYRLDGLKISTAAFTNLTRDHLDYHKTMENYSAAKERLFSEVLADSGTAIINVDSESFTAIAKAAGSAKIIAFGENGADLKLKKSSEQKIEFAYAGKSYSSILNVVGDFQVSNILCAVGIVLASGFSADEIIKILPRVKSVSGRMEMVGANIFVDYAHTPDALEKALKTLRPHCKGKLMVLFGCGGDRDKGKRPEMGKIAATNADLVIITDDNPRSENPAVIRSEILAAVKNAIEIPGRREAIRYAINLLGKDDILLIAGKGHEKTQIIGKEIQAFDDVEIAKEALTA